MCVCVCVCVCARACACVCACVCVPVCDKKNRSISFMLFKNLFPTYFPFRRKYFMKKIFLKKILKTAYYMRGDKKWIDNHIQIYEWIYV